MLPMPAAPSDRAAVAARRPAPRLARPGTPMVSLDLLLNAIVAGLLLGGFYAAVTVGVTISFGMLDIVNIAHPAFIMLGSFRRLHRQLLRSGSTRS